jgi:hypothetical protein
MVRSSGENDGEGKGGRRGKGEVTRRRTLREEVATAVRVSSETVVCDDSAGHGGSGEDGNLGEVHGDRFDWNVL